MSSPIDPTHYDAIILGAGGAGLMAAAVAGQRGKSVIVIDHADAPGKKILISGGGRCNFTNLHTAPDRYLSENRHFAKSALGRYTAHDFIALVDGHGIAWHEKTLGQLFCDGSASQIVQLLLDECTRSNSAGGTVEVVLGHAIRDVTHADARYQVTFGGRTVVAPALILATGGPAIPKMGATGFAYEVARKFGLGIIPPRPALVPLTLSGGEALFRTLSGVAADVVVRYGKTTFREACLFTHKGLSGPAILQISSYWQPGGTIEIDFLQNTDPAPLIEVKRTSPRIQLKTALASWLPERLAATLANRLNLTDPIGNLTDTALEASTEKLRRWPFRPTGTEGFAKAEVTAGGIDTAGLSSRTMEARSVPGLYCIGEAVDVTGWLGGYNFQWAWASGHAAGTAITD